MDGPAAESLWRRLRTGDRGAREELVTRYAPLVKHVMRRMALRLPPAMDADDVLSAGTVGLLHAIDRFDPAQGVRFETYALPRIRGAIIDALRTLSPLARGAGRRARLLDETATTLAQRLGRAPTQDELARELGVDLAELRRRQLEAAHAIVSLDGEARALREQLHDPAAADVDDVTEGDEMFDRLSSALAALPPRDRTVLTLYYERELMLKDISRVVDVSVSRVSQIHTAAVTKLRAELRTLPAAA
ncbi:MAG TPA: FliA/WhiG family RNA polymerase sigma factor [Chloroflexota bacterium]|jgi:RNA polymerase sigma factor for flagellar operon FliA